MFKIYSLLILFGLLAAAPVHAQYPATTAEPASPVLTRLDTARAVHELFKSRRGGGFGWLAFGGAGMAASIIPAQQSTSAGVWTPGVVIGSGLVVLGTKKIVQFGWGREQRVLRDLAATGHLPADVKRRLRGNFAPLHRHGLGPQPFAGPKRYSSHASHYCTSASKHENFGGQCAPGCSDPKRWPMPDKTRSMPCRACSMPSGWAGNCPFCWHCPGCAS
jgi:hypothetical protein